MGRTKQPTVHQRIQRLVSLISDAKELGFSRSLVRQWSKQLAELEEVKKSKPIKVFAEVNKKKLGTTPSLK